MAIACASKASVLSRLRKGFTYCPERIRVRCVDYGMARPSEDIEYDNPSLKEEEPIHDDFNFGYRYRQK